MKTKAISKTLLIFGMIALIHAAGIFSAVNYLCNKVNIQRQTEMQLPEIRPSVAIDSITLNRIFQQ